MIRLTGTFNDNGVRDDLERLPEMISDGLDTAIVTVSEELQARLQEVAPVGKAQADYQGNPVREPGQLRASIRFMIDGKAAEFVAVDYSEFVIAGTSPHAIVAGKAGALSFYWEKVGAYVAYQSVRHPGTKPNDFREPALAATMPAVDDALYEVASVFERL